MSKRGREHQPRWGLTTINPNAAPRYTAEENMEYLNRVIRRANKAAGCDTAKKQMTEWAYTVTLEKAHQGVVLARTKSEARSQVKKALNIKTRLPIGTKLEKVNV